MQESRVATPPDARASAARPHTITRGAVFGWVTYDLANTIFSMGVVSLFLPLWFRETMGAERVDVFWGIVGAISYAIIFVVSPLLGAMTDRAPRRMPFLVVSTLICVLFTALLGRAGLYWTAAFFIIANIGYQAGLQFYDAMLPEVSTPQNRGRIGGIGIGLGYLGSFLAVSLGFIFGQDDIPFLFLMIAISFLLFSLPCFFLVRERGNPNPRQIFGLRMMRESTRETLRALRSGQEYPGLLRFLVGRVVYTDAINTLIMIMAIFTVNVAVATGLSEAAGRQASMLILLFAVSFAVAGGFVWGWVVDRIGPKRTLDLVLLSWMGVFLMAGLIGVLELPLWVLYLVAAWAGISIGGTWAADRPFMLRLTPPHRIGEFYGLYGMVGRFSAITGPATWALILFITVQGFGLAPHVGQGVGALVLLVQIVVSYWILRRVTDEHRRWETPEPTIPHPPPTAPAPPVV